MRRATAAQEDRRSYIKAAKKKPCAECGLSFLSWAMDFDHLVGKDDSICSMVNQRRVSVNTIRSEIEKCDLVCVLCHRLRTKNRGYVGPLKERLPDEVKACPCSEHGLDRVSGCRGCKNAGRLADYYRRRSTDNRRSTIATQNRRAFLAVSLKSKPCTDCDHSYDPVQMDFDHVRGKKVSNISLLVSNGSSLLSDEIGKCDLVCALCHRYRTLVRSGRNSPEDDLFMTGWTALAV